MIMKASQQARLKLRCPIALGRDYRIQFPEGWFDLVFDMCAQIEDVAQAINKKRRQRMFLPRIISIDEHHGKLVCEVVQRNRDIADIIKKAQIRSVKLCMFCGEEAHQFRRGGSLITCCTKHRHVDL